MDDQNAGDRRRAELRRRGRTGRLERRRRDLGRSHGSDAGQARPGEDKHEEQEAERDESRRAGDGDGAHDCMVAPADSRMVHGFVTYACRSSNDALDVVRATT
jgi:hypothetical protein